MPIWLVKATWIEDEAEASEMWEVHAHSAPEAVRDVVTRLRFSPHHVDAKISDDQTVHGDLQLGHARRVVTGG